MQKIFFRFLDLIFENSCVICNESSGQNSICKLCESSFTIRNEKSNVKFFKEINVYSWGLYDGRLRDGIIALKAGKKKLASYFANKLTAFWEMIPEKIKNKNCIVVPVPSHKERIKERGYCQTSLISSSFAQKTGLYFSNTLITRSKQTKYMNSLNDINERKENIKNAFEIISPIYTENILIIDDILTSGSTICELARTIHRKHPGVSLIGLTIASGDKYDLVDNEQWE